MSTNNMLIIRKPKRHKNSLFEVHENFCVDNPFRPTKNTLLGKFKTLKEAIKFANKYCNIYPYVEYRYHVLESALI